MGRQVRTDKLTNNIALHLQNRRNDATVQLIDKDIVFTVNDEEVFNHSKVLFKDKDAIITGKYTFQTIPDLPILPFTDSVIVTDVLSESVDGNTNVFETSYRPYSKDSTSLYVNGVLRLDFELVGKSVILGFVPSEVSHVCIKYILNKQTIPPVQSDIDKLLDFMEVFIFTNNIATYNGELLTYQGQYIVIDI